MSVKVSSWVWHERPEWVKGNTLVALLTLADIADDKGNCVFISEEESSQSALAKKAGMSVAQFRNVTKKLEEAKVLMISRQSQHAVNRYRINVTANFQRSQLAVTPPEISGQSANPQRSGVSEISGHSSIDVLDVVNVAPTSKRGSRIPPDYSPNELLLEWARTKAASVDLESETENFVDYWTAKAGASATKVDWDATWRTWMRRSHERNVERGWRAPAAEMAGMEWMQR